MNATAPVLRARVFQDSYRDSVELLGIAAQIEDLAGVRRAGLVMGTAANRDVLRDAGLSTPEVENATQADLVVAVAADDETSADTAIAAADALLAGSGRGRNDDEDAARSRPQTLADARAEEAGPGLVLISTPGEYATAEAWKALKNGLHVFLFSDNVPLADELELKRAAVAKDLLVMGPDCGTAIIDGIPLGFANVVKRGHVGIVGASGTGLQEVSSLLTRAGAGVSQVIGVGGRDLSAEVGGIMMRAGLAHLAADEGTEVIVCVSKPPEAGVAADVLSDAEVAGKPVIVCFLGDDAGTVETRGVQRVPTLEAAARAALLALGRSGELADDGGGVLPAPTTGGGRIRGLFCGGTLATEASIVLAADNPEFDGDGWEITDLGADEYTRGRPHPMIEPRLRNDFIEEAAADPSVRVVLLDVVLGHGGHEDPAGVLRAAVDAGMARAREAGRELSFVASVCGTDDDPQDRARQVGTLVDAGVVVAATNAGATRAAARIALSHDA